MLEENVEILWMNITALVAQSQWLMNHVSGDFIAKRENFLETLFSILRISCEIFFPLKCSTGHLHVIASERSNDTDRGVLSKSIFSPAKHETEIETVMNTKWQNQINWIEDLAYCVFTKERDDQTDASESQNGSCLRMALVFGQTKNETTNKHQRHHQRAENVCELWARLKIVAFSNANNVMGDCTLTAGFHGLRR